MFNPKKWTIEIINDGGALGKVLKMDGIALPMNYIGGVVANLCFHVEDDHFASVSYDEERAAEV